MLAFDVFCLFVCFLPLPNLLTFCRRCNNLVCHYCQSDNHFLISSVWGSLSDSNTPWIWNPLPGRPPSYHHIPSFLRRFCRHLKVKLTKTSTKLKYKTRSEINTIRALKIQRFLDNKNANLVRSILGTLDEVLTRPRCPRFCTPNLQSFSCAILSMQKKNPKWGQLPVVLFTHQSWDFECIYSSKLALCQCKWGRARALRRVLLRSHLRECASSEVSQKFLINSELMTRWKTLIALRCTLYNQSISNSWEYSGLLVCFRKI